MKETLRGYLGVGLILLGCWILIFDEELAMLTRKLGAARARVAALEGENA
jgi:hypothetical protein